MQGVGIITVSYRVRL